METHGRSYATAEEKLRRFEIYRSNVEFIEAKNREAGLTFQLGENAFTDLTHEDLESPVITTRAGDVTEGGRTAATQEKPLPDSFDWREKGAVTRVKNQKPCYSCWIFAAVATIESGHKIEHGELISLSEQEVMDCYGNRKDGCRRTGLTQNVFEWVRMNGGIASDDESQYGPYANESRACDDNKRIKYRVGKVARYGVVHDRNESELAKAVTDQPVTVKFDPNDPCFQHYCDGIYTPSGLANNYTHDMAIVGYGKTATGAKYWIAKNSWGAAWGQGGYVYLEKDIPNNRDGLCGLAISLVYPVMY